MSSTETEFSLSAEMRREMKAVIKDVLSMEDSQDKNNVLTTVIIHLQNPITLSRVLLPEEKEKLSVVDTTKHQAVLIAVRNLVLLQAIEVDCSNWFAFGCPHCDMKCAICAWHRYKITHPILHRYPLPCLQATFGGVNSYGTNVNYSQKEAKVKRENLITESRTFLIGHIEWATLVYTGKLISSSTTL